MHLGIYAVSQATPTPAIGHVHPLMYARTMATALLHTKARQLEYQGGVKRLPVPEALVLWDADWPDYKPVDYTAPRVLERPVWADPDFR